MTELEKVIKGLRCCRDIHKGATLDDSCNICPFQVKKGETCYAEELFFNAIALLKKQEPVKPVLDIDTWECGNCGHPLEHQKLIGDNVLFHEQYNYCPECGRQVRWE